VVVQGEEQVAGRVVQVLDHLPQELHQVQVGQVQAHPVQEVRQEQVEEQVELEHPAVQELVKLRDS